MFDRQCTVCLPCFVAYVFLYKSDLQIKVPMCFFIYKKKGSMILGNNLKSEIGSRSRNEI